MTNIHNSALRYTNQLVITLALLLLIVLLYMCHVLHAMERGVSIYRQRSPLATPITVPSNNPTFYKFVMPSGDEYLMVDMVSKIPFQFQVDYKTAQNPDTNFSLANTLMFLKFSTMSMDLAGNGQTNVFNMTMRFGYGEEFVRSRKMSSLNESSLSVAYWKEDRWVPFSGGYTLDTDINMMTIVANSLDFQNPVTTIVFYDLSPDSTKEEENPPLPVTPSIPSDQSTATVVQVGGGTNTSSLFSLKDETVNLQVGLFAPSKTFQYMIVDYGDSNPMPSLGLQMYVPVAFFDFLVLTPVRPSFLAEFTAQITSQEDLTQLEFVVYDYLAGTWRNFPTISDHTSPNSVIQRVQSGEGINSIGVTSIALVTAFNSSKTVTEVKSAEFDMNSRRLLKVEIPDVNYELDTTIYVDSSLVVQRFAIKLDQDEWISVEIWDPSSDFSFKLTRLADNPYPDEQLPHAALYNIFRFDISTPYDAVPLYQAVFRYYYNEEMLTFSASSLAFVTHDELQWARFLSGTVKNPYEDVVVQMSSSETDLTYMSNIIALVYGAPLDMDTEQDNILPLNTPVTIDSEKSLSRLTFALSDEAFLSVVIRNPSKNFDLTITGRSENPIPNEPIPRPVELRFFDVSISGLTTQDDNLPSFHAVFKYLYNDEVLGTNTGDSITFVRLNNATGWELFEHSTLRNVGARRAAQPAKTSTDLYESVTTIGILAGRYGAQLPDTPEVPPETSVDPIIPDPDDGEIVMGNFGELYTISSGTEQIAYRFKLSTSRYLQLGLRTVRGGEFTFQIKTRSSDPSPESELPGLPLSFFTITVEGDIPSFDGILIYQYVTAELADPLLDEKTISIIPFANDKGRWILNQDNSVATAENIVSLPFTSQKLLKPGMNNFAVVVKDPSKPFAGLPETEATSNANSFNIAPVRSMCIMSAVLAFSVMLLLLLPYVA